MWITELASDVRYGLRSLRWHPGFAAIAVISLAVGIGFNTAVFSIINTIFLQSQHGVHDPDRVVYVEGRGSYALFRQIRDNTRTLAQTAAWQPMQVDIRVREHALRRVVPVVANNYFSVLGIQPAQGRFFESSAGSIPSPDAAVVLDYAFWKETLGGDPGVIGETVRVNGVPAVIVGVAPRAFHGVERQPMWVTMGMKPTLESRAPRWDDPQESGWRVVGRLADGASLGQLQTELQMLASGSPELFPAGAPRVSAARLGWIGAVSPEKRIEFLLVVVLPLIVVGLVLWIGCSNVANLLLARAAARRKEIAIRLAAGATRGRVIRLLMTESLMIACLGGACGLLVAWWTLDLAWATLPEFSALAVDLDTNVLLYTAAVCVLATLLFGLVPAFHATYVDVAPVLKGDTPGQRRARGARTRAFFLVTQFAASMALLLVAGTFVRALISSHFGAQAAGLDRLALAYVDPGALSEGARARYWPAVREQIRQVPGVHAVTVMPANESRVRVRDTSSASARQFELTLQQVDADFFRVSGYTLLDESDDRWSASGAVVRVLVNERAANQIFATTDVVGRQLTLDGVGGVQIAGVVRDLGTDPRLFRWTGDDAIARANVLIRTDGPSSSAIAPLRDVLLRLSSDRAFMRVATLREANLGPLQRLTRMALIVSAVVLALAAIGLYGSIAFFTSQRTREIAIRSALGAPRWAVLGLLARQGGWIVVSGSVLGLALSGIGFRFMSGMLFAQWTLDPSLVAGVVVVFSLTALAACYIPGRRALRVGPMSVLRSE